MRNGWWLLLDELNLAPPDVLEALNRVLDDNRELFIAETGEVIRAHPRFQLYGAQNPAGLYGGQKQLSRAFTNRFVQLEFKQLPENELEEIVSKKCSIPPSKSALLVKAINSLRNLRRDSAVFDGKDSFATLRDLFRWADRYSREQGEIQRDWDLHLALDGFYLLGGRCRIKSELEQVKTVLETVFRRSLGSGDEIYSMKAVDQNVQLPEGTSGRFVWGEKSRRIAILLARALKFDEPVLLVGPTGCGKTTIVQMLAAGNLKIINCHQQTEASDFLGGLRPIRDNSTNLDQAAGSALFEWTDGPLVEQMKSGGVLLIDEISLADDSVLERLNSVLERERTLVLAEKGTIDSETTKIEVLRPSKGFQFVGTMNPGGDYGKKELSPALRNRLTEIWCEPPETDDELGSIIRTALTKGRKSENWTESTILSLVKVILGFVRFLKSTQLGENITFSIRDALAYADYLISFLRSGLPRPSALVHAARAVHLDSLGSGSGLSHDEIRKIRVAAEKFIFDSSTSTFGEKIELDMKIEKDETNKKILIDEFNFGMGPLTMKNSGFCWESPTTRATLTKLARAMMLKRPILLEGSPGVGKTSIVASLAKESGFGITRINLSEQTDISDLFGADLPVEGARGGKFEWKDGPLLVALKEGHWVILDELNLASQPVLEGLNSAFDHRGCLYIPELNRTFEIGSAGARFFACQNPLAQGGGRKGLPKSFLNRFTQVFCDELDQRDVIAILKKQFSFEDQDLEKYVQLNFSIDSKKHDFGHLGGPWEFNLRDLTRLLELIQEFQMTSYESFYLIYVARMRSPADRLILKEIFEDLFGSINQKDLSDPITLNPFNGDFVVTESKAQFKYFTMERKFERRNACSLSQSIVDAKFGSSVEQIMAAVNQGWMVQLVGEAVSGKSSLVQYCADIVGKELKLITLSSATDVTDLLGAFEQFNFQRAINSKWKLLSDTIRRHLNTTRVVNIANTIHALEMCDSAQLRRCFSSGMPTEAVDILQELDDLERRFQSDDNCNGSFTWINSDLVEAVRFGYWVVLDNASLASAALLDRLNCLLEPRGVLTLNERGNVNGEIVSLTPHDEFRLFLTVDPTSGDLSRPLRNRGLELFLPPLDLKSDAGNEIDKMILSNRMNLFIKNRNLTTRLYSAIYDNVGLISNKFSIGCIAAAKRFMDQVEAGIKVMTPSIYLSVINYYDILFRLKMLCSIQLHLVII